MAQSPTFRDLNKNGKQDAYEDPQRSIDDRIADLLAQMTLEEKAGMMFQPAMSVSDNGQLDLNATGYGGPPLGELLERQLNHFNVVGSAPAAQMAQWTNALQRKAEESRLGIPITLSTDPRHGFSDIVARMVTRAFSVWPETTGLAATGDEALVEEFGDIARQEYLAVGIRAALHPMADLATEPRWSRINGTFGEDAELSARMTAAYIRGFQGKTLGPHSVACMTKHFPGGGPQKDGEDPHFPYGREQVYPGDNFDYHLIPFEAAFEAGTAMIMPYYGMPVGTDHEAVGFGFNKGIITGLLREHYGFDGVVCTDWGLLTDDPIGDDDVFVARAWGVEHLSLQERVKKAIDAGIDQFGGEYCPHVIMELVENGQIPESRIDQSIRRLLRDKFRLGLFDNPYVDPVAAEHIAGCTGFRAAGELAQRKSVVLLKNGHRESEPILPLQGRPRLYLENVSPEQAAMYGEVVESIEQSDVAILRLKAPYEARSGSFLETLFHAGDLDFKHPEKSRILTILDKIPTIVDVYLDRPAVMPEIAEECAALLVNFGASDEALLDIIFGRFKPSGRLPFELPSSMEAVLKQKEDLPYDSENPLFPYGSGLSF